MEQNEIDNYIKNHKRGKVIGGLILVSIGIVLFLKKSGVEIPSFILSWPMLLIVIGIYTGFKHNFKNNSWLIFIAIGGLFLVDKIVVGLSISHYLWPLVFVIIGIAMIFGKKNPKWNKENWQKYAKNNPRFERFTHATSSSIENNETIIEDKNPDDYIDIVNIFGGTKKNVISKKFRGGDIVAVFGGAKLNFTQAEINGSATLELTNIFGGTNIIVPQNWEIKTTEMVNILGGIEDKRMPNNTDKSEHILYIRGTTVFGGVEIKNY